MSSALPSAIVKRAASLDLARGAMLLLIVLAHAPLYLYASDPGIMQRTASVSLFDHIVNGFGFFFIDARARAMFAVLFGYGLVLAFDRLIAKGTSPKLALKSIRRRSWVLILFGIVLAVVIGGQDILMAYGVAGLIVSPLLTREHRAWKRTFLLITLLYILIVPVFWGFNMQEMGSYGFPPEVAAGDTYLHSMLGQLVTFPTIPLLIHAMFPVLPSVLLGIWMARQRLLTEPQRHSKTLASIIRIGLPVSLIGALPVTLLGTVWHPDWFTAGLAQGLHILTGVAGGLAYAAVFGLIGAKLEQPGLAARSVMALGKCSLTFYVWNEAVLVLLFSPVAFDLGGLVSNGVAALIAGAVWVLAVAAAASLEKWNKNGPLEVLLRRLVRGRQ
ncbi:putative membrane protein YeiB [Paenibacillus phyllosphaerae]|uniref:Putative membrane protein YeiB n=1 Tax=Paenibacillus phyllosphaerae TaxID=274593 RepID=A0A7W5AY08_9BACL|nr:DUF418 domain-containing protein [Paenibacillus phyllosphaerae]MBB3110854.1 putative membrane protein YeiB [Paenibacillus phyllosphaerae]